MTPIESNVRGAYFDGRTAKNHEAELRAGADEIEFWSHDARLASHARGTFIVYPALGRLPGRIAFAGGASFETHADLSFLDRSRGGKLSALVASFERNWRYAAASIAGLALTLIVIFKVILPTCAPFVAHHVPNALVEMIETQQMELFDQLGLFKTSTLPQYEVEPLANVFAQTQAAFPDLNLRLKVVSAKQIGANAFALPAGLIVVTDDFITRVKDPEQMRAVLYHEAGHVHYQHTLQSLIQDSALALTASIFMGDVAGVGALVALATTRYSRQMETQADEFAIDHLLAESRDPRALGEALLAIERDKTPDPGLFKYLSSHPPTAERIQTFEKALRRGEGPTSRP